MLLRICLILAILAGLGVIGLAQFKVRPQMVEIIDTRDYNKRKWVEFEGKYTKTRTELAETQETLNSTRTELEDTKTALADTTRRANDLQGRVSQLDKDLKERTAERNDAQAQLAAWVALGIPVNGVKTLIDSEKKLRAANEALELEKLVLAKVLKTTENRLQEFIGDGRPPILDPDLRGRVVAVDPRWEFVILDIGSEKEVQERGEMLVVRDEKLVGKIRITNVMAHQSVANIMPGWKLDEVFEGDTVVADTSH